MLSMVQSTRHLKQYLAMLFFLYLIDGIALLCNISLPIGLTYGPFLYFSCKSARRGIVSGQHLHLIPLFIALFIFFLFSFGKQFAVGYFQGISGFYIFILHLSVPLSLFLYNAVLFAAGFSFRDVNARMVIKALCALNLLYGGIFILRWQFPDFEHEGRVLLLIILAVAMFGLSLFLFNYAIGTEVKESTVAEEQQFIGEKTTDELTELLKGSLEQTEIYRNPSITLEMLADNIEVPRHHLSYFLNKCLGKTFYQFIAEYRVAYAKKRLEEDRLITIESLAYECGFNSKTSLNRYFKEITGLAPSKYRLGARQL